MILVFNAFAFPVLCKADEDLIVSALAEAEEAVASAYQVVSEAEHIGANVSHLLVPLNEAGGFLTRAQAAYRAGDYNETVYSANLCRDIGKDVKAEALSLTGLAWSQRVQNMWFLMAGSILSVAIIVLGSLWGWRLFKKRYYERVLKMKPEATLDESQ
jgi:hypothetical protein